MNRRDIFKTLFAIPLLAGFKPERKLKEGFKYLGEGVYSYNKPCWVESSGKWHYMMSQHSIHLTIKEADDCEAIKRNRIHTAKTQREMLQLYEKKDLAVVVLENWEADKDGLNYRAALDPKSSWYNRVYNSARFFLMDRKAFEKEVWL